MRKRTYAIFAIGLSLGACNSSDDLVELGNGYTFFHESMDDNKIYNEQGTELIPCNVIGYDFNEDYIIAKQLYTRACDMETKIKYPNKDSVFYWIVAHEQKLFLGPLTNKEYLQYRLELHMPSSLQIQTLSYKKMD